LDPSSSLAVDGQLSQLRSCTTKGRGRVTRSVSIVITSRGSLGVTSENISPSRKQLEAGIAAQEGLRGTLAGAWEPLRIHLTCAEVLRAAGEPDAGRVLERARETLMADAERITDVVDRATFLERVPAHREILALTGDDSGPLA